MTQNTFLAGVIEGFYGRAWAPETRLGYAQYLARMGLNTYLYCPKADGVLRRRWREDWSFADWHYLKRLGRVFNDHRLLWGVGLSPYGLYLDYSRDNRAALRRKVSRIAELGAPLLAILFDDMPGDLDALAQRQAEIVTDVSLWAPQLRLLVCPTYYSFDPVLEKYFGDKPAGYWTELGSLLPSDADIFWTGNEVCSAAITTGDIEAITAQFRRPVTLWDNYPVNDGAIRSQFLYLDPLSQRDRGLRPLLTGHLCNPMNQAMLSLPALTGLAQLYGLADAGDSLSAWLGEDVWRQLCADHQLFQQGGLSALDDDRREELATVYAACPGEAAAEVACWLRGDYVFDPACLTDD